jgi:N6-adenosine-specific RNA methylase IME4
LKANGGTALGVGDTNYSFMSLDELAAVRPVTEDNAHLYLWTTNAFMVEAHDLAKAWGFKPKTICTWVKFKEDDSPSMKTGYYFRGATEHFLFCVRGSMRLKRMDLPTAYLWPRLGHSIKPDAFYDLVESASPGPYLELFARRNRLGWDTWGNECLEHVEVTS